MTTTDATSSVGLGRKLTRRCLCYQAINAPEKLFPDWFFFPLTRRLFQPKLDTEGLSSQEGEGLKPSRPGAFQLLLDLKCLVFSAQPAFLPAPFLNNLSLLTPTPGKAAALTGLLEKHHATK